LYDNHAGMLDDLATFWTKAADEFKDIPDVIGYETLNEPFAGNFYANPTLLLPGVAGRKNLQRLHDACAGGIRQHDNRHIVFYEPVTWGMLFEGRMSGSGFDHVPGGPAYRNRSAFSFHYYCDSFVPGNGHKPNERHAVCDHVTGPLVMRAVKEDLSKLGGAVMMTEGLTDVAEEDNFVMGELDSHLFSWTSYDSSQGGTWAPGVDERARWARTYARAVQGVPHNMTFDPASKAFRFCFAVEPSVNAPTEIFASSKYSYPGGRTVTTTPNLVANSTSPDLVVLYAQSAASGDTACVDIARKESIVV